MVTGADLPRAGRLRAAPPCPVRAAALAGLVLGACAGAEPVPAPADPAATLRVPPGFRVQVFAHDLGFPRMLAVDPEGTLLVSVPRQGRVLALPDDDGDGRADAVRVVVGGMELPHGLAFLDGRLYVAETGRIVRFAYDPHARRTVGPAEVVVPDLPPRGAHWTRTVVAGPDRRLYVSVGSSCNVCEERDPRRAAITRYEADGTGETRVATGLRNAVGLAFRPGTGELWATVNERDWLGDDRPPDLITRIEPGGFYGWPYCFWEGERVVPDPSLARPARCRGLARPTLQYQAHAAPLGLAFYTGRQFPAEYQGDLFVALHGSWNRSIPTGYQVIRVRLGGGEPRTEVFVAGWLVGRHAWGRPVDVTVGRDGSLFVSDDAGGRVYRIRYAP